MIRKNDSDSDREAYTNAAPYTATASRGLEHDPSLLLQLPATNSDERSDSGARCDFRTDAWIGLDSHSTGKYIFHSIQILLHYNLPRDIHERAGALLPVYDGFQPHPSKYQLSNR